MRRRIPLALTLVLLAAPVAAEHPSSCRVAEQFAATDFRLPVVQRSLGKKEVGILVLGAGSSALPGPNGAKTAYPARLQQALSEKLPGVTITVTADVKSKRTAATMVQAMPADLAAAKPSLLIWQTGTVDAMQAVDPDHFNAALDQGIKTAHKAGADVVLVNSQYSLRMESMIALGTYEENLRWVALQHEIPLFDRFGIMKTWAELGTFDLNSATKKLEIAEQVHDCIGRLLADLIIDAVKTAEPPAIQKSGQQ